MEGNLDLDNEFLSNNSIEPNMLLSSFPVRLHDPRSHG